MGKIAEMTAAQQPERKTLQVYMKSMEGEIAKALPSVMTPERFTRIVLSAISSNPTLGQCTPTSFLGAMMQSAQLGLEVNTPLGQSYILPYKNHGVLEAQFQLGYRGLIDLAYRSGEIEVIQAQMVYQNDQFEVAYGLEPKLHHVPAIGNRGDYIAVYAYFKTKSGGFGFEVMSIDDIKAHAKKYSKSYESGYSPWTTAFEEMAKKTVLKRVLKYAPLKSEFIRATAQDETIKNNISDDMSFVPNDQVIDAEYTVDDSTGEVKEES